MHLTKFFIDICLRGLRKGRIRQTYQGRCLAGRVGTCNLLNAKLAIEVLQELHDVGGASVTYWGGGGGGERQGFDGEFGRIKTKA